MQIFNSIWYICRQNSIFLITALPLIAADQLSKLWIKANLALGESIFEIGFFRLTYIQNTGSSFGLFQNQNLILSIIAITGACAMLFLVFFARHRLQILDTTLSKFAMGLIFSGTIGNLINRLSFGYVVDFLNFDYWPAFNIADSAVVVGAALLAYYLIRLNIDSEHKDEKSN